MKFTESTQFMHMNPLKLKWEIYTQTIHCFIHYLACTYCVYMCWYRIITILFLNMYLFLSLWGKLANTKLRQNKFDHYFNPVFLVHNKYAGYVDINTQSHKQTRETNKICPRQFASKYTLFLCAMMVSVCSKSSYKMYYLKCQTVEYKYYPNTESVRVYYYQPNH